MKGDEVILVAPYWVSYPDIVRNAGANPVVISTTPHNGYVPDSADLKNAISPRTKAVILNTPSNPTGAVYDVRALEGLARIAADAGLYIISDEIYEKVVFDGRHHVSIGALDEARGGCHGSGGGGVRAAGSGGSRGPRVLLRGRRCVRGGGGAGGPFSPDGRFRGRGPGAGESGGEEPVRFLLLSGKPLREPIARYGPFVMNTKEEIERALEDLRRGTFVWSG